MPERPARRRDALRKSFRTESIDALLVTNPTNVGYLSEFTGEASALLVASDRALLVSDGRFTIQIETECPDVDAQIRPIGQPLMVGVAEAIGRLGLRRVGFEPTALTVADHEALRTAVKAGELKPVAGRVEALRMIKDRDEISAIRAAIDVSERAFTMLRAGLRGMDTEKDLADALEGHLRRCGAVAASFPPIVAVGPNAALPHYHGSSAVRVDDGDHLLVDWGADLGPYKSDLTRVLVTGKVTPKFATIYRTVLAAQQEAIAAIRPGVVARDVDAAARGVIDRAGFGRFFSHGLGHGLGRDVHEAPMLRQECAVALRPGMVVTVEPGIYVPGWGGVRIEDDVLVTPEGCEVLSRLPRLLDSARC